MFLTTMRNEQNAMKQLHQGREVSSILYFDVIRSSSDFAYCLSIYSKLWRSPTIPKQSSIFPFQQPFDFALQVILHDLADSKPYTISLNATVQNKIGKQTTVILNRDVFIKAGRKANIGKVCRIYAWETECRLYAHLCVRLPCSVIISSVHTQQSSLIASPGFLSGWMKS